MNEKLRFQIRKWLGIDLIVTKWFVHNSMLSRYAQEINTLKGDLYDQNMRIVECERRLDQDNSSIENLASRPVCVHAKRDDKGRFTRK